MAAYERSSTVSLASYPAQDPERTRAASKEHDEILCFRSTGCKGNSVSACCISLLNYVYIKTSRFHQYKEDN